jgi:hypothetical protein
MLNEPRTYRHTRFQLVAMVVIFAAAGFILFTSTDSVDMVSVIPVGIIFVAVVCAIILSLSSFATISETEITSGNILGSRTLAWSEINRVSGSGYRIKLHNTDGDVTVSPSAQLPEYEEIVDWISRKRPDLFNSQEFPRMSRSWVTFLPFILLVLFAGIFAVVAILSSGIWILSVFFLIVTLMGSVTVFSSPQSITIDGRSLIVKYLTQERTLPADEIKSVEFAEQRSRNGRRYYVVLNLPGNKIIRISSMKPGLPIVYLTLKNWHERNKYRLTN